MFDPSREGEHRPVPKSMGVPMIVRIAVLIGVVAIFAMGADTLYLAQYGHGWPSTKTLRIPLNGSYNP